MDQICVVCNHLPGGWRLVAFLQPFTFEVSCPLANCFECDLQSRAAVVTSLAPQTASGLRSMKGMKEPVWTSVSARIVDLLFIELASAVGYNLDSMSTSQIDGGNYDFVAFLLYG